MEQRDAGHAQENRLGYARLWKRGAEEGPDVTRPRGNRILRCGIERYGRFVY
jgi:hypothetical protein